MLGKSPSLIPWLAPHARSFQKDCVIRPPTRAIVYLFVFPTETAAILRHNDGQGKEETGMPLLWTPLQYEYANTYIILISGGHVTIDLFSASAEIFIPNSLTFFVCK